MPLAPIDEFCVQLDPTTGFKLEGGLPSVSFDPASLGITMPGGSFLQAAGALPQNTVEVLLGELSAALMPFQPIFDILDVLLLMAKVMEAVKTLNLVKLGKTIPPLLSKIDKLKALVPQVAAPLMIVNTIDLIIAFLGVLKVQLHALIDAQLRVDTANARAVSLGAPQLTLAAACGQSQIDAQLSAMVTVAAPINRLLDLLNTLAGIAGLPELPALGSMSGGVTPATNALDSLVAALTTVRSKIPV